MVFFVFSPLLVKTLPINLGIISITQDDLTSRSLNLIKKREKDPPFSNMSIFTGSRLSYFPLENLQILNMVVPGCKSLIYT